MSRSAPARDMVSVRPQNNVYTILAIGGSLVLILAIVVLWMRMKTLFGDPVLGT